MRARITRKASIQSVYRAERIIIGRIWPKVDPTSSFNQGSAVSVTGTIDLQPECGVADSKDRTLRRFEMTGLRTSLR